MNEVHLLSRYPGNTLRYTSFPTAPHFEAAEGGQCYAGWLAALPASCLEYLMEKLHAHFDVQPKAPWRWRPTGAPSSAMPTCPG